MKCKLIKSDKTHCRANSISNSDYCFSHDPDFSDQKKLAVKKGGLAPKKTTINMDEELVLDDAKDAKLFLAKVINGVWNGSIPATPVANTLGFLVRCFLEAHEKSEIEDRLARIEEILTDKPKR